jgi:hypothetical protein
MSGYTDRKDPLINVRSTNRAKDTKDRDIFEVKIGGKSERDQHQVQALIDALLAIKDNPNGVKLKFYTQKKEYNGRQFDSTFFFVAPVQEGAFGSYGAKPQTKTVVKPAPTYGTDVKAAAASLKKPAIG